MITDIKEANGSIRGLGNRIDAAHAEVVSALRYFNGPTSKCPKRNGECEHCNAVRALRRAEGLLGGKNRGRTLAGREGDDARS